jgi:hypothetical protein
MRHIARLFVLGLFLATLAFAFQPGDELTEAAGTVKHVGRDWYGLVPDSEPGTRFAPENLPEEFREDGLKVVFSGTVKESPEGVRMWGTPFEISEIRRAE